MYKFAHFILFTFLEQVFIGNRPPIPEADLSLLKTCHMLAIYCKNSDQEPAIASSLGIREDFWRLYGMKGNIQHHGSHGESEIKKTAEKSLTRLTQFLNHQ